MHADAVQGPYRSLGSVKLGRIQRKGRLSEADIGRAIGAGRHMVCRWLSGQRRPGLAYAGKLHELYGIPILDWTKDPPRTPRKIQS